jgi:hypothetical protein
VPIVHRWLVAEYRSHQDLQFRKNLDRDVRLLMKAECSA